MKTFISALVVFLAVAGDFNDISEAIKDLINSMWGPCLAIAGASTLVMAFVLGIKWWTAGGDEQRAKQAKKGVVQFVVGLIIIFVIAVGAPMAIGALATWANGY